MKDVRLEILESTMDNIKNEVIEIHKANIKYGYSERLESLLDELAENTVKYNRILTSIMGFKPDEKSNKIKEVIKLALIEKYKHGKII